MFESRALPVYLAFCALALAAWTRFVPALHATRMSARPAGPGGEAR